MAVPSRRGVAEIEESAMESCMAWQFIVAGHGGKSGLTPLFFQTSEDMGGQNQAPSPRERERAQLTKRDTNSDELRPGKEILRRE